MKILLVNIFSKIKQLGIETFDIYSNIQKDSSNQIENLKMFSNDVNEVKNLDRKIIMLNFLINCCFKSWLCCCKCGTKAIR